MPEQNPHLHLGFGIDEVYFHPHLDLSLLKKLEMRAQFTLESLGASDIILVSHKKTPDRFLIKKFVRLIQGNNDYIQSNTLLNENEVFEAVKSKNYVLVTSRTLS